MQDQLILLDTAKLAKEKGFNEPTQSFYYEHEKIAKMRISPHQMIDDKLYIYKLEERFKDDPCIYQEPLTESNDEKTKFWLAPTQSLLQKWLRETHKLCITITFGSRSWDGFGYYHGDVHRGGDGLLAKINWEGEKDKFRGAMPIKNLIYEEALEEGLKEALKLIILQSK